jgi:acid phosphatase type 7
MWHICACLLADDNEYRVMWASEFSRRPILKFGSASGKYDNYRHALSAGIEKGSLCGAPANSSGWYDMGLTHTAILEANGPVYYTVGDEELGVWSKEEIFTPPPARGKSPSTRPTRVVLLADMGIGSNQEGHSYGQDSATQVGGETFPWQDSGYPSYNTSKSIERFVDNREVDVVFLNGDISYANGYIVSWQYYLNMISTFSRKIAFLNTLGNHEVDSGNDPNVLNFGSSSGGECGVLSTTLLPFPDERASLRRPWWSYDVGLIHFVGMSTEHNFSVGSEQYLWIENDLKTVDRKLTPWVIFGGHRSVYLNSNLCCKENVTCGTDCYLGSDQGVSKMLQDSIEPLLYRYRVNIAFSGHLHEIQRQAAVHRGGINELLPGAYLQNAVMVDSLDIPSDASTRPYDGKIAFHDDPQATVYMLIGTAGQGFQVRPMSSTPAWNEETFLEYGYGVVTAVNATCLIWETIRSADDSIIDKMVIIQSLDNLESGFGSQRTLSLRQKLVVAFYSAAILLIIFFAMWQIMIARYQIIRNKMRSQAIYIQLDVNEREVVGFRNHNKSYGTVTIDI